MIENICDINFDWSLLYFDTSTVLKRKYVINKEFNLVSKRFYKQHVLFFVFNIKVH